MRPKRIELEGFTAFREPTTVDFEDTDLFVLVGPTGSGKSSLIDAMIFALYGSVPRYKDVRLVAPVVSQGKVEARVRLDFSVCDVDYTAVRVVRLTKTGASTREARLESAGEVLAGNPRELNEKVVKLLGLTFEQFTSCVVLPQGEFANFLNDKRAERQDLLVRLLGLGLYDGIRSRATAVAAEHRNRSEINVTELESLTDVTWDAEKGIQAQLEALRLAQKDYQKAKGKIEELNKKIADLQVESEQARKDAKALAEVKTPDTVAQLTAARRRLHADRERNRETLRKLNKQIADSEQARLKLGDLESLVQAQGWYDQRTDVRERLEDAKHQHDKAKTTEQCTRKTAESAAAVCVDTEAALQAVRASHHAYAVREHLAIGEPCPVCGQEVIELPKAEKPLTIVVAEKALAKANADANKTDTAHREAVSALATISGAIASETDRLTILDKQLETVPTFEQVKATIDEIHRVDGTLDQLRQQATDVNAALDKAKAALDGLKDQEDTAWYLLGEKRDALAHLAPAPLDRDDLQGSWSAFMLWVKQQLPQREKAAQQADESASAAKEQVHLLLSEHKQVLTGLGYEIEGYDELGEEFARFEAKCDAALMAVQRDLQRKQVLEKQVAESSQRAATADSLARHLRADRFERWLLEAAFEQLVLGASRVLHDLSNGQYSFAYNDRLEFEIVDHSNADETRSAKTLSGGETFLASLALALTLADQVADLAAHGAARLESMFLDEGFGSLDPDTLDTVAAAIEELGTRGRVIGLVTHVSDLAERVPVQYRVSKGPSTATVERINL